MSNFMPPTTSILATGHQKRIYTKEKEQRVMLSSKPNMVIQNWPISQEDYSPGCLKVPEDSLLSKESNVCNSI